MGITRHNQNSDQEITDIAEVNMIPLVDVMLVLLIIFMVTAPLSIGGINVDLPKTQVQTSTNVTADRIILTINRNGELYMDKTKIPDGALSEKMRAIFEFRKDKELHIRADRGVPYGSVVDAMSAAKTAGVDKISMLARTEVPSKK